MTTTTPAPPIAEPDPSALTCPGGRVGPCSGCQRQTHTYGSGGSPLCQWCMTPLWRSGARTCGSSARTPRPARGNHARRGLGRVKLPAQQNSRGRRRVMPCMKPINEAHVAVPGLAVVEVADDDASAFAVQELLAARWAIAPADRTTREPGEPGVRLRCFLDMRQEPDT